MDKGRRHVVGLYFSLDLVESFGKDLTFFGRVDGGIELMASSIGLPDFS